MKRICELKERNYRDKDEFDYAPLDFEDALDSYDKVLEITGEITGEIINANAEGVVEFIFISVVAFFEFANTFHHRIVQVILEFRYFCVKICHLSLLAILFIILNHLRHNFFDGSVDYVVGNRIDRSIRIVVDRDDDTTFLHTGDMLDLS